MLTALRDSVRAWGRTPGVAIVAVASLALGIGATTTFYSLVDHLLLRTLPVPAPHELVLLSTEEDATAGVSFPVWQQIRARHHLFRSAFAWTNATVNLAPAGEVDPAWAILASGDVFRTLAIRPALGRLFDERDDGPQGGPDGLVAVISDVYWRRRFGGSPDAIGRSISVEGVPFTVIGVTPPSLHGFRVGTTFDLVLPLGAEPRVRREFSMVDDGRVEFLRVMMRVAPGVPADTLGEALRADQDAIRAATLSAFRRPEDRDTYLQIPFVVTPSPDGGGMRYYGEAARLLFGLGCLVLLACCGNVSTVLLAHGASRQRELGIRVALGASRWDSARQLLADSFILSSAGGAAGLVLSVWAGPLLLSQFNDTGLDLALSPATSWRIWASAAGAVLLTSILCGLAAARRAASVSPSDVLKARNPGQTSTDRTHMRLVGAQLAFSVVVVVTSALLLRSYNTIVSKPALDRLDGMFVAELRFARSSITGPPREDAVSRILQAAALPGVVASVAMNAPFTGGTFMWAIVPSGAETTAMPDRLFIIDAVSSNYFLAFGVPLVAGRPFDDRDRRGAPLTGIANRSFARQFLGGEAAVPQQILADTGGDAPQPVEIVGVVEDMPYESLLQEVRPALFLSRAQRVPDANRAFLIVRPPTGGPLSPRDISAAINAAEPRLSYTVVSLTDAARRPFARERMLALVAAFFLIVAALIAGLGVYGVVSYSVTARRQEFGIRLALGAQPQRVGRLVVLQATRLAAAGAVAGLIVAWWIARWMSSILVAADAHDAGVFTGTAVAALLLGVSAAWWPARRAARLDPAEVLRAE